MHTSMRSGLGRLETDAAARAMSQRKDCVLLPCIATVHAAPRAPRA